MTLKTSKRAFTLIELLVVVAMIAIIMGAMTTSVTASQQRARIQKATAEVNVISQAILAYENYAANHELEELNDVDADATSLGFLLGKESGETGDKIPALLMASLTSGGTMRDPWGQPYKIRIKRGNIQPQNSMSSLEKTGYYLPNFYRLSAEERK
ncbi:MAG: prepilin-type N-terminal cleavage/methylation domain-containing protein [Kiritimatiellae bacterium]|nr:prepilin-type N-terminal cleavage/methylation domain-containing protein [Kiritimatiellia bacterium]